VLARLSPAWLWLLVGLQVAVPASYYLVRDDRDDERFAWRMFSSVRLKHCDVRVIDRIADGTLRPVDLPRSLHASWIRSLERGRSRVIERFLATRCQAPSAIGAVLERRCQGASGQPLPDEQYHYECGTRQLLAGP
jgi:hypothetical protein